MSLHQEIMNLPCTPAFQTITFYGADADLAYKLGHRDARHAAAQVINSIEHKAACFDDLLAALKDVAAAILESEHWWIDEPSRGGFDLEAIEAAITKAEQS